MNYLALLLTMIFSTFSIHAMTMKTSSGSLKFTATGKPGFLKIRGESKNSTPIGSVNIQDSGLTGEFTFDLKSLDTGISLRNEHMKEKYLEVGKFPDAKLVLKTLSVMQEELKKDFSRNFTGTLTLHGVSREISGKFNWQAAKKEVSANFDLKVSDYNIAVPQYMGVVVSEMVDVEVIAKLDK